MDRSRFRRRHFLVTLTCCLVPLASLAQDKTAKYQIKLDDRVDQRRFPELTIRFTIADEDGNPARKLPDQEITVYEDKKLVHRFRPQGLRAEPMVGVLALDTSGSMFRLNKLVEAKRAALRFFDKLAPETPCGLVLFHHQPYQVLPIGMDRGPLRQLVETAQPKGGTAYFDAAATAIDMFAKSEHPGQRAVVLMTDGRDVNSQWTLRQVIQRAKEQQVKVYTLGLGEPGRHEMVRTVLVLDRSGSMAEGQKMPALKKAASRFIQLMSSESADTTIIAFNHRVPRAGPFTSNKKALLQDVAILEPHGETALFDATYDAIETLSASRNLDGFHGRRAVIVLTDGRDEPGSRRRAEDVIQRARTAEVKVYMLGFGEAHEIDEPVMQRIAAQTGGRYFNAQSEAQLTALFEDLSVDLHDDGIDEASLKRLAEETGGEYYHVQDADRLAAIFERVAVQLESSYAVTFRSLRDFNDGTARGLEIRFGDLAVGATGYTVHGLIAATGSQETRAALEPVYLSLLGAMAVLLSLPGLIRRLYRFYGGTSY